MDVSTLITRLPFYPTSQKQLDIVLNLNQLTKKERIEWQRADREQEGDQFHSVPVYEAEWKDHRVQTLHGEPPLEKNEIPIDDEPDTYWIRISGAEGPRV
jgi:hypothetical protein